MPDSGLSIDQIYSFRIFETWSNEFKRLIEEGKLSITGVQLSEQPENGLRLTLDVQKLSGLTRTRC